MLIELMSASKLTNKQQLALQIKFNKNQDIL